jgi:hypothetical protein
MSDSLTACIQPVVAMVCICFVVCTAISHGHNGWLAIVGCSALSGIAGYNLRPAIEKLRALAAPTKTENR